ncbi:MAG: ABC transporter permease [Clostridia bacterium]|nr:ABC transporter permease [Clostridia bacterium]
MNEENKRLETQIPKSKFEFAKRSGLENSENISGESVGYFKDAWRRFCKNKSSLVATAIIGFLLLFSLIAPVISPYTVSYQDDRYKFCPPENKLCVSLGLNFWDGCEKKILPEHTFQYYRAIGTETGENPIKNGKYKSELRKNGSYYSFRMNSVNAVGCVFLSLTKAEYASLQDYQDRTGRQVIYPTTNPSARPSEREAPQLFTDANYWYKTQLVSGKDEQGFPLKQKIAVPVFETNGEFINIYASYTGLDGYRSLRLEGQEKLYDYAIANQTGYEVRVKYAEYYRYYNCEVLKNGIETPNFLFGTTQAGKDLFTCLGSGARLSFLLALSISFVNMCVGGIYGAIEGYYGGGADLVMERISDILSAVPFMIVITLLKMHFGSTSQLLILFVAFFLTGWISMAKRVRMQFYRYKNREYVLSAKTLGATDGRIMRKHVLPNAIGTIITGSVLSIPATIFSESSLSYLGIINLNTGSMTSVGTLLSNAQPYLTTYPYMILFPALFICLLMLSFNLFGNGLRDAFNPTLRGEKE